MTTPQKTGFFDREPQVVQGIVLWLLTQLGAIVLGHTHLVSSDQWSSLTTALVPIVTAVVIGVITFVWRRWLSPAWKVVEGDINKVPFGPEIEKLVEDKVAAYLADLENRFPARSVQVSPDLDPLPEGY